MIPPRRLVGASIAFATMHRKEAVVQHAFRRHLGVEVVAVPGLDTDRFGTFSGEVERKAGLVETARAKAEAGLAAVPGAAFALASEGAFGPDPALPFGAVGHECLLLLERGTGHAFVETRVFRKTVFAALDVVPDRQGPEGTGAGRLAAFLARVRFPRQALVLRRPDGRGGREVVAKGVASRADLRAHLDRLASERPGEGVEISTDMRADRSPNRRATLRVLACGFARRLAVGCPACGHAGFGLSRPSGALACAECGGPTTLAAGRVVACEACGHAEPHPRADGLASADPMWCPRCNP